MAGAVLGEALLAGPVSSELLGRIAAALPYPSLALAETAAVVYHRLAGDSDDPGQRAGRLVHLSNHLSELGRREQALAAIEEAVTIRRQLADARPDAFLPNLATSLNNLGVILSWLERNAEASAAHAEAAAIHKESQNLAGEDGR